MNRQEAQELLPWFVAGTLSEDESRAVQAFIDSGEISETELNELSLFADTVRTQSEHEPAYNPAILEKVMEQLDEVPQNETSEPLIVQETTVQEGLFEKLRKAFQWDATPRMAKLAIAGQFAAVLALAVMIGSPDSTNTNEPDGNQYRTISGAAIAADLLVGFAPGTTETQMRELLMDMDAQITAGPNSIGVYSISLPADADIALIQSELRQNSAIIYVQPAATP
ncbi:MAG: hypothetical protein ACFHXK_21100 [bacterium]